MVRHKIDDEGLNPRRNAINKKHYNIEVIRLDYKCLKCCNDKAFYKRGVGYTCTKCKFIQRLKRGG